MENVEIQADFVYLAFPQIGYEVTGDLSLDCFIFQVTFAALSRPGIQVTAATWSVHPWNEVRCLSLRCLFNSEVSQGGNAQTLSLRRSEN